MSKGNSWRTECATTRAVVATAQDALRRGVKGPVLKGHLASVADAIEDILVRQTRCLDPNHVEEGNGFVSTLVKNAGGRGTERAMAASAIARSISQGEKVSREEELELESFLEMLRLSLIAHVSEHGGKG